MSERPIAPALAPPKPAIRGRIAYFDVLRAAALTRVVVYHTIGGIWIHRALPAMGVMFALAGSLVARSLQQRGPFSVILSRARRLLPPLWAYGAIALVVGWKSLGHGTTIIERISFWVLPLRDPHVAVTGLGLVDTLWYIRAYLWFVILSPLALLAFRRNRVMMLLLPLALLIPLFGFAGNQDWIGRGWLEDILTYGTCWMIGFAEFDGVLGLLSNTACAVVVLVGGVVGLGLQIAFANVGGFPAPLGYAVWNATIVLALMRWQPDVSRLMRVRWLRRLVTFMNARAVTIYLWHDLAIAVVAAACVALNASVPRAVQLVPVLAITALLVIAMGWVEDLAARRRPTLFPDRR